MLPARHRMRRSAEFATTVRHGHRAGRKTVVVYAARMATHAGDQQVEPLRIGFIVSKSVGNAVVRNRTRRRLRHVMQGRLSGLEPGRLIVVRALPAAARASEQQLDHDLRRALDKLVGPGPQSSGVEAP